MKTRTYQKACDYCNATGFVPTSRLSGSTSSSVTETCPVCKGNKTVLVTETETIEVNLTKQPKILIS